MSLRDGSIIIFFYPGHQVVLLHKKVDKLTSLGETPQEEDVMILKAQI
jgi:hypothetical protein